MGLSLVPADDPEGELRAEGSYTAFNDFRFQVAAADGIDLAAMDGYGGARAWVTSSSPLVPLLDHADSGGELTADECARIIPRLSEILELWWDTDPEPADPASPRPQMHVPYGRRLVEVMRACVGRQVSLLFA
ncbi:hypothetical protein [Catenulispora rubra]|uniref:hypothetical protein n=1 Tax=Catenulispora rubra TaxID=280293 RepID=UPI0018923D07|nr:hypothetical protein [Catenulispora rubra]